ncbi:MAG: four helix bundle protein [Aliifodinibius sp.]|nr:four helix bundle protein [Fodinibius sp.]
MNQHTPYKNINRGYMKLEVWQKSLMLYQMVCGTLKDVRNLDFKSRSQLVDCLQSISANIAEGYSRRSINEYLQHLYIAMGSLSEALTRIIELKIAGILTYEKFDEIDVLHYEIENKMINLIRSLEKKREENNWQNRISEGLADYETKELPKHKKRN